MKQRILRLVRTVSISAAVLLVLVLGAGAAYTWYVGQDSSNTAVAQVAPVAVAAPQTTKSRTPAPDAPASVSIQQLTSPASPGGTADVTVRSNPTATCKIAVEYSNKQPETDPALAEKATDDFGMAGWQWTVGKTAPKGKGAVMVTCSLDEKRSAVVKADLEVMP